VEESRLPRIAEAANANLLLGTRLSFRKRVKGSASQPADMTAAQNPVSNEK